MKVFIDQWPTGEFVAFADEPELKAAGKPWYSGRAAATPEAATVELLKDLGKLEVLELIPHKP